MNDYSLIYEAFMDAFELAWDDGLTLSEIRDVFERVFENFEARE